MKVSGGDNQDKAQLKSLNHDLKNQIIQKENEISKIKDLYDRRISEENALGEMAYQNKIEQNNQKVLGTAKDVEEKLKNYNQHLEKTKSELAMQEKNLREANAAQISDLKSQNLENLNETYNNSKETEENLQYKTQNSIKKINEDSRHDILSIENKAHANISALSVDFNNQTLENEKLFRSKINEDIKQHQEDIRVQRDQFKNDVTVATEKNQRLENEKLRVQNEELNFLDQYHKNLMDQKQADFKVRYEILAKEHEDILNKIKQKLDNEVNKAQKDAAVNMQAIKVRSDDPFYRIEKLVPQMTEDPKSYFVTLKIPPHEKNDVHLIAHGRELKLTFSKKFTDNTVDEDGSYNRTAKSQLYSKEFKTAEILNPKNITEKYEDGVLTFKVDKL